MELAAILRVPQMDATKLVWGPEHTTDEQTAALAADSGYHGTDSGYLADLSNGWWCGQLLMSLMSCLFVLNHRPMWSCCSAQPSVHNVISVM